jgi:prepilin-type N-terminal cleavage/methylation domain-containing protein
MQRGSGPGFCDVYVESGKGEYPLAGGRREPQRTHSGLELRFEWQLASTGLRNKMAKSRNRFSAGASPRQIRERGMTMLELMIAMAVLAIGMTGAIGMILAGIQSDIRNKNDTASVVLDQEILEQFAAYQNYPQAGQFILINDCSTGATQSHQAGVGAGAAPTGNGATLYTAGTAPFPANVGDIDWTQPAPVFATAGTTGYAMNYQTCNGDTYEVRWNVMKVDNESNIAQLTVSSRQISSAGNRVPMLFAVPTTLRTIID